MITAGVVLRSLLFLAFSSTPLLLLSVQAVISSSPLPHDEHQLVLSDGQYPPLHDHDEHTEHFLQRRPAGAPPPLSDGRSCVFRTLFHPAGTSRGITLPFFLQWFSFSPRKNLGGVFGNLRGLFGRGYRNSRKKPWRHKLPEKFFPFSPAKGIMNMRDRRISRREVFSQSHLHVFFYGKHRTTGCTHQMRAARGAVSC